MDNKSSITSLMSAFARAYICKNDKEAVFSDKAIELLIKNDEYEMIKNYIMAGADFFLGDKKSDFKNNDEMLSYIVKNNLAPNPVLRARFCEDSLKTAVLSGVSQYVILGAGLDTFAFREKELMKKLIVFETDYPKTQEDKLLRIKDAGLEIPKNLKFVAMDFSKDNLKEKLISSGFDMSKKTFFSFLGVSYYLTEKEISGLFENIASFASEGSTLLFDYAEEEFFQSDDKRIVNMINMARAGGEPMKFCANAFDLEILLERCNFLIYETMSYKDISEKYLKDRNDGFFAFPHISFCLSVLKRPQFKDTKEAILITALKLFARNGYEAVSVRDIAGKIGITQSALYKHYKNKRDIFDCILKRMEEEDFNRAKNYEVPEGEFSQMSDKYKNTTFENMKKYTYAQFCYWTENEYASNFRKMITIEQYRSLEMAELFKNYLSGGVINYVSDIFGEMINNGFFKKENPYLLAAEFYAPLFLMMNVYDTSQDKEKIKKMIFEHIEKFGQDKRRFDNEEFRF